MELQHTAEITWLIYTVALTAVLWVPYILQLILKNGLFGTLMDRLGMHDDGPEWTLRAKRAHYNAVENLAVFAPLAILVAMLGVSSSLTATAAMVFFFARLVHYVVQVMALPVLRTVAFLVGFGCQVVLILALCGVA